MADIYKLDDVKSILSSSEDEVILNVVLPDNYYIESILALSLVIRELSSYKILIVNIVSKNMYMRDHFIDLIKDLCTIREE